MKLRIVVIDDHSIVRESLIARLAMMPNVEVVGEGQDGTEAVKLAGEQRPDIVVMDIGMPRLNGVEATRQIIQQFKGTKVIALSMHSERRFVCEALAAGVSAYVLKSGAFEELEKAISSVAQGCVYLSPEVQETVVLDYAARAGGSGAAPHADLTLREREVLQLVAEGMTTKQIAQHLSLSVKTVETHRRQVMDKLNIDSVGGLVRYAIREGIATLDQ